MPDLENVIRPFLPPSIGGGTPQKPKEKEREEGVLVISGSNVKVLTITNSHQAEATAVYARNKHNETKRTYDTVRIKNPDDPSQHVDAEVMTKQEISRHKSNKLLYDVNHTKQQNSANIEVIKRGSVRSNPNPKWD